ncbi:hypothetical protein [Phenylobacterium soli]|uniref:hypothetical protein n=1 Tax=Phenylobacterium soli TaxID=2170551 RepID=UPI001402687D|nr:hypothetical protein [Phenylobacterium soli]
MTPIKKPSVAAEEDGIREVGFIDPADVFGDIADGRRVSLAKPAIAVELGNVFDPDPLRWEVRRCRP